ncbi:hypothetical protein GPECTOR_19g229 [Gonium pectorale]|uniref:FAD dependent oxidoreductase domain-containing protein n=1 Tax=Gonium pectorale TaxID=33097 RepID=A0A150GIZ5_GONPE|nr:hypothetical protein GPECTOR_19g229 [Gonium pectorale]|eukprot:KXZ49778.1 hypothetical protein GPECTOR_19g229 [Gonium pectorale]
MVPYDAVVVGLGAFGSAALYHLAKAGLKVLGIERHHPVGHALGSSHGASRIIRLAYFEGLQYGPLLKRSYRLFQELEEELAERRPAGHGGEPGPSGPLFLRTGMLDVGNVFEAAHKSAVAHGLQHEVLTGAELNRRFPAFRVPEHWRALYQPDGGVLTPERIVQAHVALAQQLGAEVATGEAVTSWRAEGRSAGAPVTLTTAAAATTSATVAASGGRVVSAGAVVLSPGPWIGQMVPELRELCVPERQVVGWFEVEAPSRRHFAPDRMPVWVLEEEGPGGEAFYGFPEHGELPGLKIGLYHHLREQIRNPADLDAVRRTADAADEAALRRGVSGYFPAAASGRLLHASACFFTNTPDGHFLIDRHPAHPQVILCSACSGHGFKMSSGIGQLIARMVCEGEGTTVTHALPAAGGMPTSARAPPRSGRAATAEDAVSGGADSGWEELVPFRFDAAGRPGHAEALQRFG